MRAVAIFGPWGIAPVGFAIATAAAVALARAVFAGERPIARAAFGATAAAAGVAMGTRAAAAIGCANAPVLFGLLVAFGAGCWALARRRGAADFGRPRLDLASAPHALLGAGVLGLSLVAAYLLPVWQYDALGYHLPFVDFVLSSGTSAAVPPTSNYIGTYPHAVEWCFVALRALLPDDRLIDLAQIPFGALGALAVAGIARTLGARRGLAIAAGVTWLAMPAAFLQLPTDYVDVASASMLLVAALALLQPPTPAALGAAALALGMYLGSKPSAPIGVALLFGLMLARAWPRRGLSLALAAAVAALGAESYVANAIRFGNPVYPVALDVGPLHLPGTNSLAHVLSSGPGRSASPLAWRVLTSWFAVDAPPVFDMRRGGFGAVAPIAIVVAVYFVARRRQWIFAWLLLAAIASPDPAVARYVLAMPGLALAAAAALVGGLSFPAQTAFSWGAAVASLFGVVRAAPALVGEGPPLAAYLAMDWHAREIAVGADGPHAALIALRDGLAPGETFGFDVGFDFTHLAFRHDFSTNARFFPREEPIDDALAAIGRERVKLLALGDGSPLRAAAGDRLEPVMRCSPSTACGVYRVVR